MEIGTVRKFTSENGRKVRYAVVGVGWIAQEAVLPGFANAPNSELVALLTDHQEKAEACGSIG